MIEYLSFHPFPGLASPHAQTIIACFNRAGRPPPSQPLIIKLPDGDALWCSLFVPTSWQPTQKTIIMVHGLGGSHLSNYMIRMSRKLYQNGYRVIAVNLRGCGPGRHLARLHYHGGNSQDILAVLRALKQQTPHSPFILLGFSLGGNIALKLAGELGAEGPSLLHQTLAVCPPIDLDTTVNLLSKPSNRLYLRYYLKNMQKQVEPWIGKRNYSTFYEFDNLVTAPNWGFQNAFDYYHQCSSLSFIPLIQHPCRVLFAMDDPFIDYRPILKAKLPSCMKASLCRFGGHMGFLGRIGKKHRYFWLDHLLQTWINQADKPINQEDKQLSEIASLDPEAFAVTVKAE
ncbi:YheT family hydrolase [Candidatus Protochlamydia phocaeensis]|uniref:YheT family hydrolase n=1 Tax=Candidatus Protochlamydia phocaeensis TaxID=1414722 RepID=UPI000839379E|nr:alpha/beta fold hydrolase [Candidatus Protochlamydia phocaeensis]